MVRHVVLMKFKPDIKEDQISKIKNDLGALPGIISEIRFYEFGKDEVRSDRSYDFCLVSAFEDFDSLKRYQVHPDHVKIVNILKEICEDIRAVDYTF
ncbi:Stress responsive alpha-beta barrel domain-containing protein [Desulfonema limicola]|uniref:Stress responsive alpha-beta barrel domain-containing protein n=1 Tax=Desulfonema limicola TaxID=45656 RepID=A0A975B3G8_9BACT|nr:Dabb family protein [Desulfonema limicola]QTA78084.1 Stress responsive alpha-beta barrel domain-containing protein [Desulfonema limicola]